MSQEILSFEIVIDAKLSSDTKKNLDELKSGEQNLDEKIRQGMLGLEKDLTTTETGETIDDQEAIERLEDFIKTTDKEGMKNLASFAKNPSAMIEGQLLRALAKAGIYGLIAAAIISLILAAPDLIKLIVEQISVKGGPLNQDFHRYFEDEGQRGLDRDIQYKYAVGLDVIITNYQRGYLLQDPGFVGSNLVDIESTRLVRLTNNDIAYGYVRAL